MLFQKLKKPEQKETFEERVLTFERIFGYLQGNRTCQNSKRLMELVSRKLKKHNKRTPVRKGYLNKTTIELQIVIHNLLTILPDDD